MINEEKPDYTVIMGLKNEEHIAEHYKKTRSTI